VQNSSPTIGFLQKVSTNGQDSWRVEMGNPSGVGFINDVACPPNGVFVCGSFKNQASIGNAVGSHFVTSNGPFFDAVAFKLNPENGQPIWSTTFGSSSDDSGSAIHADANGNVYVAGRFQGTANYANIPQATLTANGTDTYVWKLDYTGEGTGGYSLTNGIDDEIAPTAIHTAIDGAIYVAGRSYGTTDFDHDLIDMEEHTSYGYADGFLHRTTDCDAFLQPESQEVMFCQGDSVLIEGTYYNEPQLLITDSLTSQWGCDSLISYQLSQYFTDEYEYYSICPGDSIATATGMVNEPGEYITEYTSVLGCDSSFIEIVNWIPTAHYFENYTLCPDSSMTIYGQTIQANGNYQFFIENPETTCRDTVSVTVSPIDISGEATQQGNTLVADQVSADQYTWIDCNTGDAVLGAYSPQFSPQTSGSYAVIVYNEGCAVIGSCNDIEIVGIQDASATEFTLFPNPANDVCNFQSTDAAVDHIDLFDTLGRSIKHTRIEWNGNGRQTLALHDIPPGVYTIVFTLSDKTALIRTLTVH
jgi:hypothetical protein